MDEHLITVKEMPLNNNCPECYGKDGLLITFKQKVIETKLYKSITSDIQLEIKCTTCHTTIYPVQWTDEIERVVKYQRKAFTPMATSTYIKKPSWIIIASTVILIAAILILVFLA
jgi:hypothetical protein